MEQVFADDFLAGVYFRGIKFSPIEGKSAKFAKIRSRKNFMPYSSSILARQQEAKWSQRHGNAVSIGTFRREVSF